ncbi:MAG: NADH:ubiquinone reductase (Na(+)-transporting) subunit C [Flavobacteriales bacterium]
MSINKEGNGYTLTFAIIMVAVVGGLLAFIASSLKPLQQENVKNEKMQNILQAIGIEETAEVSRDEAGAMFNNYITERIVLDYDGNVLQKYTNEDPIKEKDNLDAFNVDVRKYYNDLTGLMKKYPEGGAEYEAGLKEEGITYPMFVCEKEGEKYYITYFSGKGLWDDIWGYISLKEDGRTINGSVFDHKGETPGLGSKITEEIFNKDFLGKVITNEENEYRPIKVLKPGLERKNYEVQGLSGATFTHVGVEEMMKRSLAVYSKYFKNNLTSKIEPIETSVDSTMIMDSTYVDSINTMVDENPVLATK